MDLRALQAQEMGAVVSIHGKASFRFCACIGTMNRVRRELARERLGLWRRSLRSRRFGWCSRVDGGLRDLTKLQIPSSKSQGSCKHQAPKRPALMLDKGSAVAGSPSCVGRLWDLRLGASLELGVWSLELYQPTHSKNVTTAKAVTSRTPSLQMFVPVPRPSSSCSIF
jgi:hypothetical protein